MMRLILEFSPHVVLCRLSHSAYQSFDTNQITMYLPTWKFKIPFRKIIETKVLELANETVLKSKLPIVISIGWY